MRVQLRPYLAEDAPLIHRWLHAPHIVSKWGPASETLDPTLTLLRQQAGAIILQGDSPLGLIIWSHPAPEDLTDAGLGRDPKTARARGQEVKPTSNQPTESPMISSPPPGKVVQRARKP